MNIENINIIIAITCFNRREKTLSCLENLFNQQKVSNLKLNVIVVDDNSCDGTHEAIKTKFPTVDLIVGNGSLYWNGGMRLASEHALRIGFDYLLWLNDDTVLASEAILNLLGTYFEVTQNIGKEVIVVGTTRSSKNLIPTYGGVIRKSWFRRTGFTLLPPRDCPVECETMNGNCVLIPRVIVEAVGALDRRFVHGMGDFDYGLRARKAGYSIWITPGYIGVCDKNTLKGTFRDSSLSFKKRWQLFSSPKGLPLGPWLVFCRRHAGLFWPLFFIWPIIRFWIGFKESDVK